MHARLRKAMSTEGCEAGRQHTHTVRGSRKSTAGNKVNRQRNKQPLSLGSRTTVAPVRMQNKHQHCLIPQKRFFFFYSGTFPVEAQEEPINLTRVSMPKEN